jgi:hypothetical protein
MSTHENPAADHEIERLLRSLEGVMSARVVTDRTGRLEAIHILSLPPLHPKQVVRNVESAMSAGLGMVVDRRLISVAQVRDVPPDFAFDAAAPEPADDEPAAMPPGNGAAPHVARGGAPTLLAEPDRPRGRLVYMSYDARTQPNHEVTCRVSVRRENEQYTGTATGTTTPLGRAQTAARALFSAITEGREIDNFVLDDVGLVQAHGRNFVLVAAHAIHGREPQPLTGVALLTRAPEEAAILASLQAVNRWTELDD